MSGETKPSALVVEDDEMQSRLIAAVLRKLGIASEIVTTARDFIQRLKETKPDFCLVDLNIEKLGIGFTVIEAVRKVLGDGPTLIVVSGNSDTKAIAHALELGANDYLVKPIDHETLAAKVAQYVSTPQLLDAISPLVPLPGSGVQAVFDLELSVRQLDEFGVKLKSSHFLVKGSTVALSSPIFQEILGSDEPVAVTIMSTSAEADGLCGIEAEFDRKNEKLLVAVRKWLAKRE